MHPQLSIGIFVRSPVLAQSLSQVLNSDRYLLSISNSAAEFLEFIEQKQQHIDCLVLQDDDSLPPVINQLYEQGTLLPLIILPQESKDNVPVVVTNGQPQPIQKTLHYTPGEMQYLFHAAEVRLDISQISDLEHSIEQAITQFLALSPNCNLPNLPANADHKSEQTHRNSLTKQQYRLSEKLKERLGYLGVYYKRNPQFFFRYLPNHEKDKLLEQIKNDYRQIVLMYFSQDATINQLIDNFVNEAFFADISVSKIVEIHMDLMDDFSQQLKLEGRNEEILMDYRLTLIDVIAHLGEMYRRSIPREL